MLYQAAQVDSYAVSRNIPVFYINFICLRPFISISDCRYTDFCHITEILCEILQTERQNHDAFSTGSKKIERNFQRLVSNLGLSFQKSRL